MLTFKKKWIYIQYILVVGLVGLITFVAYGETLQHALLNWDDQYYVTHNPYITELNWENIQKMFAFYQGNWTPLTWLSHAFVYAGFNLEPWGHHLANVVLHCINTLLVFLLTMVLIAVLQTEQRQFAPFADLNNPTLLAAGMTALLFGIHPQHVEAVAWVSARKDVLSQCFMLSTLLCYLFYAAAQTSKTRGFWYLLTLLGFILALLAKPIAIMLPFILILLDIYPLKRTLLTQKIHIFIKWDLSQTQLLEKIPFFLLSVISLLITTTAQHQGGALTSFAVFGINERLFNAANNSIFYLYKLVFPIILSPLYPLSRELNFLPLVTFLLITSVCGYAWYKQRHYWLAAWLFYLIALFPVLGFIQFGAHATADRFAYFPTLPFYFLIGIGFSNCYYSSYVRDKVSIKMMLLMLGLGLNLGLFHLTKQQAAIWRNDLTLWHYAVLYQPNNAIAQTNLGHAYLRQGHYEKALTCYHLAISASAKQKLFYEAGELFYSMGIAYLKLGQFSNALNSFNFLRENNLEIDQMDMLYYYQGWLYHKQGRWREARLSLEKALVINPKHELSKSLLEKIGNW